jgi:hypothetical protein
VLLSINKAIKNVVETSTLPTNLVKMALNLHDDHYEDE